MHTLLLKLQAEVEARKHPRADGRPVLRNSLVACLLALVAFQVGLRSADADSTGWATEWQQRFLTGDARLRALEGEVDLQRTQLERLQRIYAKSARYGISADLAAAIEDIALSERVDPDLAFELVRVESRFYQNAVSPVGALGFTQLMPATARLLKPGISRSQILDRDTNLRLGFRFLRGLIRKYDGNLHLALLAYNRGPERVDSLLRAGENPDNGYSRLILDNVKKPKKK